jgi:hypothetical protein
VICAKNHASEEAGYNNALFMRSDHPDYWGTEEEAFSYLAAEVPLFILGVAAVSKVLGPAPVFGVVEGGL